MNYAARNQAWKWMCEQSLYNAARLYLIENVLGLEEAEKFFETIPEKTRDYSLYNTLLTSYVRCKETLDKAEATFDKMRELGVLLKPNPFNSMLTLYNQHGMQNMVEEIMREVEEKKVEPDDLIANNVLRVYGDVSNIEAMEKYMKECDGIKLKADTIIAMAKGYERACLTRKAIAMYGDVAGSEEEVYTLWNKECNRKDEKGYGTVIRSLVKLGDVEGAEKIYGEWKPEGPEFDMSIPLLLISHYCTEEKEAKVEEIVKSIKEKQRGMQFRMFKKRLIRFVMISTYMVLLVGLMLWCSAEQHRLKFWV